MNDYFFVKIRKQLDKRNPPPIKESTALTSIAIDLNRIANSLELIVSSGDDFYLPAIRVTKTE